jgi:hypothetical protein
MRFWLKVGGLIIFFTTLWGSPNLSQEQGSPLGVGLCLAEESFAQQTSMDNQISEMGLSSATAINSSFQGSRGIMSINQATGSVSNQGAVVKVDKTSGISLPTKFSVGMSLGNNSLVTSNSDYSVTISGESFRGSSGIAAINQAAGNLNNQVTAVGVSVGGVQPTTVQPTIMFNRVDGTSVLTGLSTDQLSAVIASSGNTVTSTGNQKASATVQDGAFKDFTGLAAVTQVAGNMNQVVNSLRVNVNTR